MRDMNPRSACRRTPTLMEIHMTTYKPTGEKPDEFNLYLQERMAALGLDPKTIAENTGIALPTVLTHLNFPGKPIKPQSIQKFAAELNVPYAVLRDLYTRVRCQGKVRTKYVIGMMPKGETALLAMMIKNTLTYRSIPMTDFSEMTGIPLDQLMYPPRKPSDAFVAALAQGFDVGEDAIREHATSLVGTKDRTPIVLSELQKRGLCFRDWIAMTNCSVENAYRLLVGRFPLDPDLKITAALALRIDPEEFIFRYDTSKSTRSSRSPSSFTRAACTPSRPTPCWPARRPRSSTERWKRPRRPWRSPSKRSSIIFRDSSPPFDVSSTSSFSGDDRVAGDESLRTRSGGSPWCGNIRWNPFQRSYRLDTVFCRHSTCCAFQVKSKSRSEFSSSVDA